jgi:hypothetical protein
MLTWFAFGANLASRANLSNPWGSLGPVFTRGALEERNNQKRHQGKRSSLEVLQQQGTTIRWIAGAGERA